jgi:hypothetical protein
LIISARLLFFRHDHATKRAKVRNLRTVAAAVLQGVVGLAGVNRRAEAGANAGGRSEKVEQAPNK